MILVSDDLDVVSLRIYQQESTPSSWEILVETVKPTAGGERFAERIRSIVKPGTEPWSTFAAAVDELVSERREEMRKILEGAAQAAARVAAAGVARRVTACLGRRPKPGRGYSHLLRRREGEEKARKGLPGHAGMRPRRPSRVDSNRELRTGGIAVSKSEWSVAAKTAVLVVVFAFAAIVVMALIIQVLLH